MTNYAAWDAFDVDRAIEEVDKLQTVKEFNSTFGDKLSKDAADSLELTENATRKSADALRSKVIAARLRYSI